MHRRSRQLTWLSFYKTSRARGAISFKPIAIRLQTTNSRCAHRELSQRRGSPHFTVPELCPRPTNTTQFQLASAKIQKPQPSEKHSIYTKLGFGNPGLIIQRPGLLPGQEG